jgi:hypothetical protein
VGPPQYLDPRIFQTLQAGNNQLVAGNFFFDPTPGKTYVAPPPDHLGSASPFSLLGPGRLNWDLSMFKNFVLRESMSLQFRAEAFNVLNHTSFRSPNTTASSRDYGTVSASVPPRLLQFGLKLYF